MLYEVITQAFFHQRDASFFVINLLIDTVGNIFIVVFQNMQGTRGRTGQILKVINEFGAFPLLEEDFP